MDQDVRIREHVTSKELERKKKYPDPVKNPLGEIDADDDESVIDYQPTKVQRKVKQNFQHFYYMSQKGLFFNTSMFIYEIIGAIIQGTVITIAAILAYRNFNIDANGQNSDFWCVSIMVYSVLILVTNLMTLIRSSHITWLLIFAIFATSIGPFIAWMILYDRWTFLNTQSDYSIRYILSKWHYYLCVVISTFVISFFEICKFFLKFYVNPTMNEYYRTLWNRNLTEDPDLWEENIIQQVKKNSASERAQTYLKKNSKKTFTKEEEDYSAKVVRAITRV